MSGRVVRRAQAWLGTLVSLTVAAPGKRQDLTPAFAAVARVHRAMSPHEAASDVARFNRAGAGERIVCDPWTVQVLRLALRLRQESGGLFDVSLGTARGDGYRVLDDRTVLKLAPGRIDLGGIAKGYAVDRAVLVLRACGIRRGMVNAGGDLRAFGTGAWPVLVRPEGRPVAAWIELERGALATSQYGCGLSPYRGDALIAPTCAAVHAVDCTVTVAAPRCALADALTKVVALSGDAHHPLVRRAGGRAWLQ